MQQLVQLIMKMVNVHIMKMDNLDTYYCTNQKYRFLKKTCSWRTGLFFNFENFTNSKEFSLPGFQPFFFVSREKPRAEQKTFFKI